MSAATPEIDLKLVLERLDRTSPDALIGSIAKELVRLHRAHAALEARLAAMETLAACADQLSAAHSEDATAYPDRIEIDAASAFVDAVGLCGLERHADGQTFRWTGPERHFSFQLFLDRRAPARFVLSFIRFMSDLPVDGLRGFVDGREIELKISQVSQGYEAEGEAPPRQGSGATVLTFLAPEVLSPREKDGTADDRLLGLMFVKLAVEPVPLRDAPHYQNGAFHPALRQPLSIAAGGER